MLTQRPTLRRPVHRPSTAGAASGLLLTRYAGCLGRVISEMLTASSECAGYLPPHRVAPHEDRGERS